MKRQIHNYILQKLGLLLLFIYLRTERNCKISKKAPSASCRAASNHGSQVEKPSIRKSKTHHDHAFIKLFTTHEFQATQQQQSNIDYHAKVKLNNTHILMWIALTK